MTLNEIFAALSLNEFTHVIIQQYSPYFGCLPLCGGSPAHVLDRLNYWEQYKILRTAVIDNKLYITLVIN